ncbi:hypothetical protein [Modestobacter altitudinis]|uniref:hypothetical protein n=1 Tax=Modestobacter altitudinis TaxID=2213158 RepID=UPI00110CE64F|nr:hypothetical protein [Modestobacter altitudinis]
MSTPTSARDTDRVGTAVVPRPRRPSEPPLPATVDRPAAAGPEPDGPVGLFGRYSWLTAAAGIACTVAVFVAMIVLTWAAGGLTPFND